MAGIAAVLRDARSRINRIEARDLPDRMRAGAWVFDLRPVGRRERDGHLPGAVVIDRLVLEWRLDPTSRHRMAGGPGLQDEIYLVCNEGFASSLAARDLRAIGFTDTGDLVDGFAGWRAAGLPIATEPTRQVA